ncbi:uncharacterized protein LOC107883975 [Acyrthosiphon pisum]|uniref:Uncharacterized protein n=1 Tax=Acyrthosiphon pisum TaxID=7029 RepID=A0A8R2H551_ACYPI|nr:uncharacterized protein LOC107883975 [Acyrthosiphon pisum]XP_029346306.1 uncharacterized protein LOC107883975 [Acyrthosiphon pisum]|eukprot:XP_016660631.1 PREDICTED: uncharacterized protein LOC107883975 [Acyrthosiphon pisum]
MRIREYELPVLKRVVVIYVQNDGNVVELHKDPEVFFGHSMDRDNNTELSETKSLKHQNTFKDVAMGQVEEQVVDSKTSKMRPWSKYQLSNSIETAPIKLEKKCVSFEIKEYPMKFAEELKELHRVKMLNDLPTIEKIKYPTFVDELKELHRVSKLNELENL